VPAFSNRTRCFAAQHRLRASLHFGEVLSGGRPACLESLMSLTTTLLTEAAKASMRSKLSLRLKPVAEIVAVRAAARDPQFISANSDLLASGGQPIECVRGRGLRFGNCRRHLVGGESAGTFARRFPRQIFHWFESHKLFLLLLRGV
jgi:hypothetical protein